MENTNNALHQKYRPEYFEDLYGNPETVETLMSLFDRDIEKIPKVFLLTGNPGTGKTTTAYAIKNELECESFFEYNGGNERKLEDIRRIIQETKYPSLDGGVKIYFFDECHQITPAGFEALNKPLEFTENNTFFILATSEPDKVPAAIKTRATHLHFNPLSEKDVLQLLNDVCADEKFEVTEKYLKGIAKNCEGSSRLALKTLDTIMGLEEDSVIENVINQMSLEDTAEIKELCQILIKEEGAMAWKSCKGVLKSLKDDPEKVRRAVLGYLNAVVLNNGGMKEAMVMECFEENYFNSGKAGLTLSCFKACNLQ